MSHTQASPSSTNMPLDADEPRDESPSPAAEDTAPVDLEACDADAFMDEDDAEAVAERLRQLGYI